MRTSTSPWLRHIRIDGVIYSAIVLATFACLGGCAVQYYDASTQTEHLWGFGHLALKRPPAGDGVDSFAHGSSVIGLGVLALDDEVAFAVGWHTRERLVIPMRDAKFSLEWKDDSLFAVDVSGHWPAEAESRFSPQPQTGEQANEPMDR